ncbi:MAG: DNA gyrase inhibitor YacG [Proteobacteria bacterium]|jgi:uncharacterized protein|nr:DNA gyrase inhibitor YacG [Pseudomonadota bacterium]MDA1299082.1 DNA gyrase inhibitor YacG [Pseudomonadota bacterium]
MPDVIVKCPTCSKAVAWIAANKFRPFCSERCQLIDLGEWAEGNRRIPADPTHDQLSLDDIKGDQDS